MWREVWKRVVVKTSSQNEKKGWWKMKMKKRDFRRVSPSNDPEERFEIRLFSIAVS